LARAERLLAPLGAFVAKVFQSPEVDRLRQRMARHFTDIRLLKPEASRKQSTEMYLVGKSFGPETSGKG
jgi:23S rRNA (uridine2552-2'-O)-methyltransferase